MVELCELCEVRIVGIIDNALEGQFADYPVLGTDQDAPAILERFPRTPVIITPDSPAVRRKLAQYYSTLGFTVAGLVSPKAVVSRSATIGAGTVVQSWVNVSANAEIGALVKLNTGANVMHDSIVGDYTTIAPNAVVLGRVAVGAGCYIGANATLLPETRVQDLVTVGAGAVVVKDVETGKTVKGVPAR